MKVGALLLSLSKTVPENTQTNLKLLQRSILLISGNQQQGDANQHNIYAIFISKLL